jgi:hypothetical protein
MSYIIVFMVVVLTALWIGNGPEGVNWPAVPAIVAISALLSWPIGDWLSKRRDTFDPICLLALFGVHFFLLGPQYQLANNYFPYLNWNPTLQKWSSVWFYSQAAFLFIALLSAHAKFRSPVQEAAITPALSTSTLPASNNYAFALVAITFCVKVLTFLYFGGVSGVLNAYETRLTHGVIENNPFAGLGPLVLVGDMFPIALGLYCILRWRHRRWFASNRGLFIFAAALLLIALFAVGLRGSRSSVVFAMAVVVLSYHYLVRPLRKWHLIGGAAALVVFMQGYLVYKFGGLDAIFSEAARQQSFSERKLDEGPEFVLIRDFTRMDVQTISLYRVLVDDYPLAWGRSLFSGITAIIPSFLFPGRPITFILEKTEILFPNRSFDARTSTTLVFGGLGEIFVNFGWLSLLLAWPFGTILRRLRHTVRAASNSDAAAILAPLACLLPIALLVYDSNSLAYFFVQFCSVSLILAWVAGRRERDVSN